jgi:hypothetical protein
MRTPGGIALACALVVLGCGDKNERDDQAGDEATPPGQQAPPPAERSFELPIQHANRDQTIEITAPLPAWELETGMSKDAHQVYRGTNVVRMEGPWFAMALGCHGTCQADALRGNVTDYAAQETARFTEQAGRREGSKVEVDTLGGADQPHYGFVIRKLDPEGALDHVHVGVAHFLPDDYDRFVWCSAMLPGEHAPLWETIAAGCEAMQVEIVDPHLPPEVLAAEAAMVGECPEASAYTIEPGSRGQPLDPAIPTGAGVKDVHAYAPRPGNVRVTLASVPIVSSTFRKDDQLEDGQVALQLDLYAAEGAEVVSGDYPPTTEAPRVDARIHVAGGRSFGVGSGEGQVTITARTIDRVCGTFDLRGAHHHLQGGFDAPLEWQPRRRPR